MTKRAGCRPFDAQIGSNHKFANFKMRLGRGIRPTENIRIQMCWRIMTPDRSMKMRQRRTHRRMIRKQRGHVANIQKAIQTAANNIIARACKKPKDHWISEEVLDLVEKIRNIAKQRRPTYY